MAQIEAMEDKLTMRNSYINNFRSPEALEAHASAA